MPDAAVRGEFYTLLRETAAVSLVERGSIGRAHDVRQDS